MAKGAITGEFTRAEATEEKLVNASAIGHELANSAHNSNGREN
jgi:erythritol transport system ATP-binding protein